MSSHDVVGGKATLRYQYANKKPLETAFIQTKVDIQAFFKSYVGTNSKLKYELENFSLFDKACEL